MTAATRPVESMVSLNQPGRLIGVLAECIAARIGPNRSGWSAADHLGRDLERHFGVRAPQTTIEHALRVLQRRRAVRLRVDEQGLVWYKLAE